MENYIITEKDGKLLGAYFPTIMGLFVNASKIKLKKRKKKGIRQISGSIFMNYSIIGKAFLLHLDSCVGSRNVIIRILW